MLRPITGYHTDADGDPVAELSCGHGQHVRHQPPMTLRPWVLTEEGRASMLGTSLGCVRCDQMELPEGFVAYKRTAEFDEHTVPAGLRANHSTRVGVWGRIQVRSGRLIYRIESDDARSFTLDPEHHGVVVPELPHHVAPDGPVRFYVEFYRKA